MPAATSHLNRTEIIRSFTLTALIIIMDMSGFAGLAAQDELDERQEVQSTHSGLNAPGFMTGVASQKSTFDFGNWGNSACAVMDNGELACWGSGDRYLIYQNHTNSITPVVRDDFPNGISVSEISLGAYHRCALMSNSKVYCWGSGYPSFGGQSYEYNRASPTVVQDSAGNDILATQVSSDGNQHSCAIL
ncbi:MAG: hypothetical protein ACPHKZ_05285, partial [Candidatus Thalassarchaeaceae archaeon]